MSVTEKPFKETEELCAFLQDDEDVGFGPESKRYHNKPSFHSRRPEVPWMISTAVLAVLLVASLLTQALSHPASKKVNENVSSTELQALRPAVEYELQQYTGILTYNETLKTVIRVDDAVVDFFGPPGDEMDKRWQILLHDEFPVIADDEVPAGFPDIHRFPDGRFHFEPDFLHNLHCLNELRKQVSKTLYPDDHEQQTRRASVHGRDQTWDTAHINHCMDRIRQALMCHADLTPSIMHRWEGFNVALGQTGPRKCRKWQPIRQWMDERNAAYSGKDNIS